MPAAALKRRNSHVAKTSANNLSRPLTQFDSLLHSILKISISYIIYFLAF